MKRFLLIVLGVMALVATVWAADVKISDMPSLTDPDGGDVLPIVDVSGMTNRKVTVINLMKSGLTTISGTTIDWTSGTTLPRLAGVTDYVQAQLNTISGTSGTFNWSGTTEARLAGVTDSVQAQLNIISGTSASSATGDVTTAELTAATNADSFTGTTNFATNAELTAHTLTLSGASGEATLAKLTTYTNIGSFSGVSDFATNAELTAQTNASAFSGTTNFSTNAELTAHTLSLSGVSGEATHANLTTYTAAAAFTGTTDFALNSELTTYTAPNTVSGTSINWSGTTLISLAGVTGAVQGQLNTLGTGIAGKQAADADLTTYAGITPSSAAQLFLPSSVTPAFVNSISGGASNFIVSAVTPANIAGAPDMDSGASSYVLTAKGVGTVPIWTNVRADMYWSGTSEAKLANFPDSDGGTSSYVLTSTGVGKQPIWTNTLFGGTGSGTVQSSSEIGLAMYNVPGTGVTGFVSGTSGALLRSAGSGATPVWGTTLDNMSITTAQAWEKNRVIVFDASGVLSGATQLQYSGVSNQLNVSGVSLIIQSGTSPTGVCTTGQIYLDTDADTNGSLYSCVATGQWKEMDDDGGAVEVTQAELDAAGAPGTTSGTSISWTSGVTLPYLAGVTSYPQTQLNTISGTSLGWTSGVTLARLADVTGYVQQQMNVLSGASVAWASGVTFPRLAGVTNYVQTQINTVSGTSLNWISGVTMPYLAGVTSSVQAQLNIISGTSGGSGTGDVTTAELTAATNANAFSGTTGFMKIKSNGVRWIPSQSGTSVFTIDTENKWWLTSPIGAGVTSIYGDPSGVTLVNAGIGHYNPASKGYLYFMEKQENGGNWVRLAAPDSLGSYIDLTLPSGSGVSGQALMLNDGTGSLTFSTPWQSGVTGPRLAGVTDSVQTQLNIISGTSGGSATGDMTKAVYDADSDNKVDVLALDFEAASISGVTLNWASGVTLPYLAGVTANLQNQLYILSGTSLGWTSGTTMPYLSGVTAGLQNQLYVLSGTSLGWASGVTMPRLSGVTASVQTQLYTISGTSNTLEVASAPSIATVGKMVYDTTGPQILTYGTVRGGATEWVVAGVTKEIAFVISGVTHGKNNTGTAYTDQDDMLLFKSGTTVVLKEVHGILDSGTTVLWNVMNCSKQGASCADMLSADITSGSTGNMKATDWYTFTDSVLGQDEWLRLDITWSGVSTTSGVTANFSGTLKYFEQRQ